MQSAFFLQDLLILLTANVVSNSHFDRLSFFSRFAPNVHHDDTGLRLWQRIDALVGSTPERPCLTMLARCQRWAVGSSVGARGYLGLKPSFLCCNILKQLRPLSAVMTSCETKLSAICRKIPDPSALSTDLVKVQHEDFPMLSNMKASDDDGYRSQFCPAHSVPLRCSPFLHPQYIV